MTIEEELAFLQQEQEEEDELAQIAQLEVELAAPPKVTSVTAELSPVANMPLSPQMEVTQDLTQEMVSPNLIGQGQPQDGFMLDPSNIPLEQQTVDLDQTGGLFEDEVAPPVSTPTVVDEDTTSLADVANPLMSSAGLQGDFSDIELSGKLTKDLGEPFQPIQIDTPKTVGEFVSKNLPGSAFNLAMGTMDTLTSPIRTAKTLTSLATGLLDLTIGKHIDEKKLTSKEAGLVRTLKNSLVERYGSLENIQKTFLTDPAGFLSDVTPVMKGVGLGSVVSKLDVPSGIMNATYKLSTFPMKGVPKVKTVGEFDGLIKSAMKKSAQDNVVRGVGLTKGQTAKLAEDRLYGGNYGEYLLEKKIPLGSKEDIFNQIQDIKTTSVNAKKAALDNSTTRIKVESDFVDDPWSPGETLEMNPVDSMADAILDNLKGIKIVDKDMVDQIKTVQKLKADHASVGLRAKELQELQTIGKENGVDGFTPIGNPKTGVQSGVENRTRNVIKETIEDMVPEADIKGLNKDIQVSSEIMKGLHGAIAGEAKNSKLGMVFKGLVGAGTMGGIATANVPLLMTTAGIAMAGKVLNSTKFKTTLAKHMHNLSEGSVLKLETAMVKGRHSVESRKIVQNMMKAVKSELVKNLGKEAVRIDITTDRARAEEIRAGFTPAQ